jgi:hypothetical protein
MEQLANIEPTIELQLNNNKFGTQRNDFDEFFLEAVEKAFSMLGNHSKELMYRYLENKCGVNKKNLPNKVDLFSQAIEAVFGQSSRLIEIKIMRTLHEKVPTFTYSGKKASNLSFVNYVEAFRLFL